MNTLKRTLLCAAFAAALAIPQTPPLGTVSPRILGETANGTPIELPDAAAGKVTLLILGFSKQGGQQTGAWADRVSQDLASDPHFTRYTIAVLEGVPTLLRGMVKSGIEKGTPPAKRDHMVTTVSGQAAWKKYAGVTDTKVPYLVLLDGGGHLRWRGHGLFEQQQYEALRAAVKNLEADGK